MREFLDDLDIEVVMVIVVLAASLFTIGFCVGYDQSQRDYVEALNKHQSEQGGHLFDLSDLDC